MKKNLTPDGRGRVGGRGGFLLEQQRAGVRWMGGRRAGLGALHKRSCCREESDNIRVKRGRIRNIILYVVSNSNDPFISCIMLNVLLFKRMVFLIFSNSPKTHFISLLYSSRRYCHFFICQS
jgi:hypothetical protein